ncbi:MAG: gliding motility-associated C-terminal domain-containing protein, partial [Bacteroidia bacterium]|nr:gliding motility-associated C-terminal domain-containing protein [Bacteroidia bacterium]
NDSVNIGGLFTTDTLFQNNSSTINQTPQILSTNINTIDTSGWVEINGKFVAVGNEEYLTIGNFSVVPFTSNSAGYYYIDDVSLVECNEKPIIPNVFSPNDDGINDVFRIEDLPKEYTIKIYDRWGITVFESNNQNTFWNGRTSSGINCVEGTYFYYVKTEDEVYKGFLQLIR